MSKKLEALSAVDLFNFEHIIFDISAYLHELGKDESEKYIFLRFLLII